MVGCKAQTFGALSMYFYSMFAHYIFPIPGGVISCKVLTPASHGVVNKSHLMGSRFVSCFFAIISRYLKYETLERSPRVSSVSEANVI